MDTSEKEETPSFWGCFALLFLFSLPFLPLLAEPFYIDMWKPVLEKCLRYGKLAFHPLMLPVTFFLTLLVSPFILYLVEIGKEVWKSLNAPDPDYVEPYEGPGY